MVGTLQFDVFEYRMKNEYGVDLRMSGLPYEHLRFIRECPCDVKDLMLCSGPACSRTSRAAKLIAFGGEVERGLPHQAQRGARPRRLAQRVTDNTYMERDAAFAASLLL